MHITRIFCANKLAVNAEITLNINASRHILHVLRLKLGATLIIFNGTGGEYKAKLIAVNNNNAAVKLEEFINCATESPLKINLVQSLAKSDKMDFIIQKAVELGVHKITPIFSERSNVKLDYERQQKRLQHWQAIAISACEQSGRNRLPIIDPLQNFTAWLNQPHDGIGLLLAPQATSTLRNLAEKPSKITLLIGPEGGLSEQEENLVKSHSFVSISLGPRILRTETASLAAISILQAYFGDLL